MNFDKTLKQYDYQVPARLIAQEPAHPRESAKLLIYDKKSRKTVYSNFRNIINYLPKGAILVFNQTKVVPARLTVTKPSGGKAEILYLDHDKKLIKFLSNRKLTIGQRVLILNDRQKKLNFTVQKKSEQYYFLKPNFPISEIQVILQKYGQTPLPPYIKHSTLTEKQKRKEYQSVFAKEGLSVAAPTASLHFSQNLMKDLRKQGITIKFVTLNVNLGTFTPLKEENLKTGRLHLESYEIGKATAAELLKARTNDKPIIAVGTTVVRTLESWAINKKLTGSTDLFIKPGYDFKIIDGMITNFHVPKSSLMMLVSSLVGRKELLELYQKAILKNFRFFSFGDGMLIL